ncbi:hypothetical protein GCM10011324_06920 [Allosediminivita pacifica]|nr:hypothetical protein GCM10011324_06920 [Allosediminivita pacifica]
MVPGFEKGNKVLPRSIGWRACRNRRAELGEHVARAAVPGKTLEHSAANGARRLRITATGG